MYVTVMNPGDQPVPVSDGASVDGGGWGSVSQEDPAAQAAIDAGLLMVVQKPKGNPKMSDQVAGAFAATDKNNESDKAEPEAESETDDDSTPKSRKKSPSAAPAATDK